ncbi:alpha/beta hydrolase [uncultured Clostridium sp.]|uniref:alpha/beta hydrolase n=1 Tax=uncultured Clostridium sp. TaxID=59620 RepID=UPI0025E414EC|nr:alpha/beta hydrolase [uncultured Clostridium sp.]
MYSVTKEDVLRTIPGSETIPRSTDLSGFSRSYTNLPYSCGSAAQKLNIVLPNEGEGPYPVIVFIHGGGWLTGDKNHVQTQQIYRLLYAGYAVCCINYRLSDEAKWPLPLHDCKAAVRFLRANAAKYNLDTERIGVAGNSAGGHLAAMMGTTNGDAQYEDLTMGCADFSSSVQAVFVWFGAYDFTSWAEDCINTYPDRSFDYESGAEAFMFGHSLKEHPERLKDASPICHLDSRTAPFYVEHGTGDHVIPYCQCEKFYQKYTELLGDSHISIRLFEGAEHSDPAFKTDENVFEFVKFFDQYVRQIPERGYFLLGTLGDCETTM